MLSRDIIYACIEAVENKAGIEYKQNMLADDMGVRPQRITELCRNKDANIGIETAKKLSTALYKYGIEVDPEHIMKGRYADTWTLQTNIIEGSETNSEASMTMREMKGDIMEKLSRIEDDDVLRALQLMVTNCVGLTSVNSDDKKICGKYHKTKIIPYRSFRP